MPAVTVPAEAGSAASIHAASTAPPRADARWIVMFLSSIGSGSFGVVQRRAETGKANGRQPRRTSRSRTGPIRRSSTPPSPGSCRSRVKTLPGVREAIEQRNWTEAEQQAVETARALEAFAAEVDRATAILTGSAGKSAAAGG